MKDGRLTTGNLEAVLSNIGVDKSPCVLRVHQWLQIQGAHLLQSLGLDFELQSPPCDEMPAGYLEKIDATVFFPWQILDETGSVLHNSDGSYDYFAVRQGLASQRRALFNCEAV